MFSSHPFSSQDKDKLCDADDAVAPITDDSLLIYGAMLAETPAVLWALRSTIPA